MKISVIIPVLNESEDVVSLIDTLRKVSNVHEIILINDGSDYEHSQLYKNIEGITLIAHEKNLGKTRSQLDGFNKSTGDYILLLDGDLLGFKTHQFNKIQKYAQKYEVIRIFLGGESSIFRLLGTSYIASGLSLIKRSFIEKHKNKLFIGDRWGFGVNLNQVLVSNKVPFLNCEFAGTTHKIKSKKYPFPKGVWLDITTMLTIFITKYKIYKWLYFYYKFFPSFKKRIIID